MGSRPIFYRNPYWIPFESLLNHWDPREWQCWPSTSPDKGHNFWFNEWEIRRFYNNKHMSVLSQGSPIFDMKGQEYFSSWWFLITPLLLCHCFRIWGFWFGVWSWHLNICTKWFPCISPTRLAFGVLTVRNKWRVGVIQAPRMVPQCHQLVPGVWNSIHEIQLKSGTPSFTKYLLWNTSYAYGMTPLMNPILSYASSGGNGGLTKNLTPPHPTHPTPPHNICFVTNQHTTEVGALLARQISILFRRASFPTSEFSDFQITGFGKQINKNKTGFEISKKNQ